MPHTCIKYMHWLSAEGTNLEFNWILVTKMSKGSPQVLVQPLFATIGTLNLAKVHLYIDQAGSGCLGWHCGCYLVSFKVYWPLAATTAIPPKGTLTSNLGRPMLDWDDDGDDEGDDEEDDEGDDKGNAHLLPGPSQAGLRWWWWSHWDDDEAAIRQVVPYWQC